MTPAVFIKSEEVRVGEEVRESVQGSVNGGEVEVVPL